MQYGIIFEGDYNFQNGIYTEYLPNDAVLIKVGSTTIGNNLNNAGGDSLYLINTDGFITDSVGYTDIAQDGFSIEKIRLNYQNNSSNWTASIDSLGTPGLPNSVLPYSIDGLLFIESLQFIPQTINQNETTILNGEIVNVGVNSFIGEITVKENDINIGYTSFSSVNELDTVHFSLSMGPFTSGIHFFSINLEINGDQDITNNSSSGSVNVRYSPGLLLINEFLPQPESGQCEFVELVYLGENSLDIQDWWVTDEHPGDDYRFPSVTIEKNDLIVIAKDSSLVNLIPQDIMYIIPEGGFSVLNNGDDEIRIFDPFDTLIDSLYYTDDWGYEPGISMEKILPNLASDNPDNWKPSNDDFGITPGQDNSVKLPEVDGAVITRLIYHEPQFPRQDQSLTVFIPITNVGLSTILGIISIEDNDEEISTSSIPSVSSGDTTFVDVTLQPLLSGIHPLTVLLDIPKDTNPENDVTLDTVKVSYTFESVMINEFLVQPDSTQIEFVEIVSNITANLMGWSISDNTKSLKFFPSLNIQPNDFIVISEDSTLLTLLPLEGNLVVPMPGFPALNNTGDGIFIYDRTYH